MTVGLILSKWLISAFILQKQGMVIPPKPVRLLGLYTRVTQNRIWATFTHSHAPKEMFSGPPFKTQNASPTWEYDSSSDWLMNDAKQIVPWNRSLPYKLRAAVPQLLGVPQRDATFLGNLKMRCLNVNESPQASLIVNGEEQVPQRTIRVTLKQASKARQMHCSLEMPISYRWLKREPRVTGSTLGIYL